MSDLSNDDDFEALHYSEEGRAVDLRLEPDSQTIWATQAQIAELFQTTRSNVTQHLGNIFASGELDEGSNVRISNFAWSAKPVRLYSLDAVISVGYRVNSTAATRFRQWATQAQIAELFATSQQTVSYHLGNVFAEGELDEASNTKKFGIAGSMAGAQPTVADAVIGKNYLDKTELYRLAMKTFRMFINDTGDVSRRVAELIEERKFYRNPKNGDPSGYGRVWRP